MVMFACFIIRIFQFVFLARTVFFSHTKSVNSTFSHGLSTKQAQANRADHGLLSWVGGGGKWSGGESDGPKGGMSLALYLRYHRQVEVDSRP